MTLPQLITSKVVLPRDDFHDILCDAIAGEGLPVPVYSIQQAIENQDAHYLGEMLLPILTHYVREVEKVRRERGEGWEPIDESEHILADNKER